MILYLLYINMDKLKNQQPEQLKDQLWDAEQKDLTMQDLSWALGISDNLAMKLSLHETIDKLRNLVDTNYNNDDEKKNRQIKKYEKLLLTKYIDVIDTATIKKLYNIGCEDFIIDNIDLFKWKVDNELAMQLVGGWCTDLVLSRPDIFWAIENEVLDKLVKSGLYNDILTNINLFKTIPYEKIIDTIIDNWWWSSITEYELDFSKLNVEKVINKMLNNGVSTGIIKTLMNNYKKYLEDNTVEL